MSTNHTRTAAPAQPFPLGGQYTSTARRDEPVGSYVSSTRGAERLVGSYVSPSVPRTSLGRYVRAQFGRLATHTSTIRTQTGSIVLGR
ncbi:hypothetical protein F1C15_08085 [Frigoribacterium sp. NBH87]|jgi:hypothetical protein|uniref:hypothetical protein n=1 Tax=unclassified Frigoribacterium TaxID=2627005 RepID=UPI001625E09E|nr:MULTISPECIES: hypothetical protein [unclassified Frigoribacterium]MBD8729048.1 hypothetical protein [Frigoribacterium sp. CFBP 13707]QNE43767.1 hypothetical protein F1C15_08085 [Frigoribacterium sp. NBH87]